MTTRPNFSFQLILFFCEIFWGRKGEVHLDFGRELSKVNGIKMDQELVQAQFQTPLGPMLVGASAKGVCLLQFLDKKDLMPEVVRLAKRIGHSFVDSSNSHISCAIREVGEYFSGSRTEFSVALDLVGTEFQQRVWKSLLEIPYGETKSYAEQSEGLGSPSAIRAVASANGKNHIAIIVPCHRVIGSNGRLTGYAGGLERKRRLLDYESEKSRVDEAR